MTCLQTDMPVSLIVVFISRYLKVNTADVQDLKSKENAGPANPEEIDIGDTANPEEIEIRDIANPEEIEIGEEEDTEGSDAE